MDRHPSWRRVDGGSTAVRSHPSGESQVPVACPKKWKSLLSGFEPQSWMKCRHATHHIDQSGGLYVTEVHREAEAL
jgi:hypothetical protein